MPATATTSTRWSGSARWPWLATSSPRPSIGASGARALAPYHAAAYGVIGDAQVELGRYDEAVETVQAMVDLRPDLSSYSRVSYLRELMGDREGALVAMEQAVTAGSGYAENVAWVRVQLGNLRFDGGDFTEAATSTPRRWRPARLRARSGRAARVAAANGDLDRAAELYAQAVRPFPYPSMSSVRRRAGAAGRQDEAARSTRWSPPSSSCTPRTASTPISTGALHRRSRPPEDLPQAVQQARAQVAARPSIVAWDVLAWTLYRSGDLDGGGRGQQGGASPRHAATR